MIPLASDLIGRRIPQTWTYRPSWFPSENNEYPGLTTRHPAFVALGLVSEFLESPGIGPITAKQLQTVFVLAHDVARQAHNRVTVHGRKNPTYYHKESGSVLRRQGSKVGRFVFGRRFDNGSIGIGYVLPFVDASQNWSERAKEVWIIAADGSIRGNRRL